MALRCDGSACRFVAGFLGGSGKKDDGKSIHPSIHCLSQLPFFVLEVDGRAAADSGLCGGGVLRRMGVVGVRDCLPTQIPIPSIMS